MGSVLTEAELNAIIDAPLRDGDYTQSGAEAKHCGFCLVPFAHDDRVECVPFQPLSMRWGIATLVHSYCAYYLRREHGTYTPCIPDYVPAAEVAG